MTRLLGFSALFLWLCSLAIWIGAIAPLPWVFPLELVSYRDILITVAVTLLAVTVGIAKPKDCIFIDRLLGSFLVGEFLLQVISVATANPFELYNRKLMLFLFSVMAFQIFCGISVWALFASRPWVRWSVLATTIVWFLNVLFPVQPVSYEQVLTVFEDLQSDGISVGDCDDVYTAVLEYPDAVHYVFYLGIVLYAFWWRPRIAYNYKLIST